MRILFLLSRVPYPIEKGDKLRAYHHLQYLSKKHEIILVALNRGRADERSVAKIKEFCSQVHVIQFGYIQIILNLVRAFFTGKPLQVGYFYNYRGQKKIDRL
ncbi:MAG TPA: hypothetical protein PK796_12135, partial [Bacteroidales bacterium]|nr:hypothetical protein [Bacteroidales bacterium]